MLCIVALDVAVLCCECVGWDCGHSDRYYAQESYLLFLDQLLHVFNSSSVLHAHHQLVQKRTEV